MLSELEKGTSLSSSAMVGGHISLYQGTLFVECYFPILCASLSIVFGMLLPTAGAMVAMTGLAWPRLPQLQPPAS